ncbi:hypothetical protein CIB93_03185 [Streptomyces sp. WZ.A104]|uniref:DUF6479 family protein n=1 Tax=Streptomyces durocortorensis TaxID=2811104 RepID=A0ABY9VUT9_9ACTN|nr:MULTISPECIES: DUF6479 family protein [Streptomyces]PCG87442.1 hypothetical protein CIB93_03185 [Streptomyces sp. WZ.A104]WNF25517.1 DUF6479 family protein [Streptomyces durocortorensis]
MDVLNGVELSAPATLADGAGPLGVLMGVAALAVVGMLIGGFILGKRKRDAEPPPPHPHEQPQKPDHRTHIDQHDTHSSDRFPEDGHALSPYELKDHGNGPLPPDSEPPRS